MTEARSEEIAFMEQIGVWEAATMDECRKMTRMGHDQHPVGGC